MYLWYTKSYSIYESETKSRKNREFARFDSSLFLAFCLRFRDITVNIDFDAYSYAGSESKFYVGISQQKHFF